MHSEQYKPFKDIFDNCKWKILFLKAFSWDPPEFCSWGFQEVWPVSQGVSDSVFHTLFLNNITTHLKYLMIHMKRSDRVVTVSPDNVLELLVWYKFLCVFSLSEMTFGYVTQRFLHYVIWFDIYEHYSMCGRTNDVFSKGNSWAQCW